MQCIGPTMCQKRARNGVTWFIEFAAMLSWSRWWWWWWWFAYYLLLWSRRRRRWWQWWCMELVMSIDQDSISYWVFFFKSQQNVGFIGDIVKAILTHQISIVDIEKWRYCKRPHFKSVIRMSAVLTQKIFIFLTPLPAQISMMFALKHWKLLD